MPHIRLKIKKRHEKFSPIHLKTDVKVELLKFENLVPKNILPCILTSPPVSPKAWAFPAVYTVFIILLRNLLELATPES